MSTPSLTDFLLARIAEDEAVARHATAGDRTGNWWIEPDEGGVSEISCLDVQVFVTAVDVDAAHIATHDPARVLAECEAKRRIVEHHAPLGDEFVLCSICTEVGPDAQMWPCLTLRLLALPYADHPDYRESWRP